jgi:heptosyltransferase II
MNLKNALIFQWVKLVLLFQNIVISIVSHDFLRIKKQKCEKIVIFRIGALGDFIFSIPSIKLLRDTHPNANIILINASSSDSTHTKKVNKYIGGKSFQWLKFVDPSIVNKTISIHSFRYKYLQSHIRNTVKDLKPDYSIILTHPGESGIGLLKKIIFLRFLGIYTPIYGCRQSYSHNFFRSVQYKKGMFQHHVIGSINSLLQSPHVSLSKENLKNLDLKLNIPNKDIIEVRKIWNDMGWEGKQVVAVAPGSIQPHKRWDSKKFVELCHLLQSKFNLQFIIIGTVNDLSAGEAICNAIGKRAVNFCGNSSITKSAALLSKCELLIGNDGGAMHLGAGVGCKTISIIPGIEYPGSIEPWMNNELSIRHEINCAPCYNFSFCPLGHNLCMKNISVTDVYEKCTLVLKGKA